MNSLSVVIITLNEERNITECIRSAQLVSDDIVVVDCGSNDKTVGLAVLAGARVYTIHWEGYGFSRNFGAQRARHDWILALDADERISSKLAISIGNISLGNSNCIYRFRRRNYLNNGVIHFGTMGFETVKRIYNRNYASWDLTLVHEKLECIHPVKKQRIAGFINHFGFRNIEDYRSKAVLYAQMSAEKYFLQGRKSTLLKRYLSPVFNSVKSYIFQLGFLDGHKGWLAAGTICRYSWLKYVYLHQLWSRSKIRKVHFPGKPRVERA